MAGNERKGDSKKKNTAQDFYEWLFQHYGMSYQTYQRKSNRVRKSIREAYLKEMILKN